MKLKNDIEYMAGHVIPVISIDESIFHQRIVVKKAWAPKGENIMPKCLQKNEPCIAVIGAMSREMGWISHMMRNKSFKGEDVLDFLKDLREKIQGPFALLLDNASIHKTKVNRKYCDDNNIHMLFLPPY